MEERFNVQCMYFEFTILGFKLAETSYMTEEELKARTKSIAIIGCNALLRNCQSIQVNNTYIWIKSFECSASMGANYRACAEGQNQTRDFINKLKIVEEETR